MEKFDKNEIEKWRDIFKKRGYPLKTAKIDGTYIEYFEMPPSVFIGPDGERIPNGLFRMTGDSKNIYVVGVSSSTPEIIKPYFAYSEFAEFMKYGLDDLDRTLHSEQGLISIIEEMPRVGEVYVPEKIILYDHIINHSKNHLGKWGFTKKDYEGFIEANKYLKGLKK